jgi:hypothetical protein
MLSESSQVAPSQIQTQDAEAEKDAEIDELDDGNFESDNEKEDVNTFKIRKPLQPPSANVFTTEHLHSSRLSRNDHQRAHVFHFYSSHTRRPY